MVKFCFKVFDSSYFPHYTTDYDDRCKSKVLFNNIPNFAIGLKVKVTDKTFNIKVSIKVSNSSYIPDYLMDLFIIGISLVYNWYQSEVLFNNTLIHTYDLKAKVTNLECLCQSFALKLLTVHIFQTI